MLLRSLAILIPPILATISNAFSGALPESPASSSPVADLTVNAPSNPPNLQLNGRWQLTYSGPADELETPESQHIMFRH
jgi:hypothetical protein